MKITQDVRDYADGLSENEKAALYPDEAQTRGVEGALATDREIKKGMDEMSKKFEDCLLYTSPSPRDATLSRMPSSA